MSQLAAAEQSLIGVTLDDKYRVLRVIGRGGMGVVYEAEHVSLGNRVAIKLMLEKYNDDSEAIVRFKREAEAASRIGNPHIIQIHDISTAPDGRAFVVMELLSGQPLSRLIEDEGALPPARALSIMRQVLRAVGAAHAKGIVHRDLKPDNIFLVDQPGDEVRDFIKLLDFGISKIIDPDMQAAATKLTTTGVVMGTPLYMAPEQAMGNEVDHRADLYACGVILYEMLAGRPPFEGQTYAVLVAKLLTSEPQLLNEVRPELSPKLVAAVHRGLEKDPDNRHASAEAFIAALPQGMSASAIELAGTVASGKQHAAWPAPPTRSGRMPWLAIGAAALVGIATATVIIIKLQSSPPAPAVPAPTPAADLAVSVEPGGAAGGYAAAPQVTVTELPDTGRLSVVTSPAGATVTIDGAPYGVTPVVVTLGASAHRVRLELAGHATVDHEATVASGSETQFFVPMLAGTAAPASNAKPIVKSRPIAKSDAAVTKIKPPTPPPAPRDPELAPAGEPTPAVRTAPRPPPPKPIKHEPKPPTKTGPGTKSNPY